MYLFRCHWVTCSHLEWNFLIWSSSKCLNYLSLIHTTVFTKFVPCVQQYSKYCWGLWQNVFAKDCHNISLPTWPPYNATNSARKKAVGVTLLRPDYKRRARLPCSLGTCSTEAAEDQLLIMCEKTLQWLELPAIESPAGFESPTRGPKHCGAGTGDPLLCEAQTPDYRNLWAK